MGTGARLNAGQAPAEGAVRVLHLIDSEGLYGAESVLLDLCSALRALGQEPAIASIGTSAAGEKPIERAARARSIPVRRVVMAAGPSPRGARALLHLAETERADLFHAHGYKPDILIGALPRSLRRRPLVVTVHGYTNARWFDRQALYGWVDRMLLRRADRVVLVHRGMASRRGLRRLHDPRWRVIENGIDLDAVRAAPRHPQIEALSAGRSPLIGAIGRLSHEKGFDRLLRAAAPWLREQTSGAVMILGEGPERSALERLAAGLGIQDRVLLPGYVPNAAAHVPLFDVFVLPSRTEGLPITLLEAMAAGVPIVASSVGGVPRVLEDGRSGLLVGPDADALGDAIQECLRDREGARRRARIAEAAVSERFTSAAMARRYLELYRELVA